MRKDSDIHTAAELPAPLRYGDVLAMQVINPRTAESGDVVFDGVCMRPIRPERLTLDGRPVVRGRLISDLLRLQQAQRWAVIL